MANKHLKGEPHKITDRCWWYEQKDGMSLVVEHTHLTTGTRMHTATYLIPWKDIRAALRRKDLPKAEKVKK